MELYKRFFECGFFSIAAYFQELRSKDTHQRVSPMYIQMQMLKKQRSTKKKELTMVVCLSVAAAINSVQTLDKSTDHRVIILPTERSTHRLAARLI